MYLYIFGSHDTIHTFKNYFTTVFLTINFQFSANKRYPNTPQVVASVYTIIREISSHNRDVVLVERL